MIVTSGKSLMERCRLAAILALLLLSSCAGGAYYFGAYVPGDYVPKESDEYGVLLASIGAADSLPDFSYVLEFRRMDRSGAAAGTLTYPPIAGASLQTKKIEFEEAGRRGIVVDFPLRPGEYEIYRYGVQFAMTSGYTYVPWASKQEFSVPFSIVAGRTTYLGRIMLDPGKREGLGALVPGLDNTGIFAVSDEITRDMDLAEQGGRPIIRANPLKEIPDPKELGLTDFRPDSP